MRLLTDEEIKKLLLGVEQHYYDADTDVNVGHKVIAKAQAELTRKEIVDFLDIYVKSVIETTKHKDGYVLVDPVGIAALAYWWEKLKQGYTNEIEALKGS